MQAARILVVDDDFLIGSLLRRALQPDHVVIEIDPHRAIERLLRGERYDVVFCDVHMPGLDGVEVRDLVATIAPEMLPGFAFMTGGTGSRAEEAALAASAATVIQKPFDVEALRQVVRSAAGRSQASR